MLEPRSLPIHEILMKRVQFLLKCAFESCTSNRLICKHSEIFKINKIISNFHQFLYFHHKSGSIKFLIFRAERSAGLIFKYFPNIVNSMSLIKILNIDSGFGIAEMVKPKRLIKFRTIFDNLNAFTYFVFGYLCRQF